MCVSVSVREGFVMMARRNAFGVLLRFVLLIVVVIVFLKNYENAIKETG